MIYTIKPNTTKEELISKGFVDYEDEDYEEMLESYTIDTDELSYSRYMPTGEVVNFLCWVAYLEDRYEEDVYSNDYIITKVEEINGNLYLFAEYAEQHRDGEIITDVPCHSWLLAERCMIL